MAYESITDKVGSSFGHLVGKEAVNQAVIGAASGAVVGISAATAAKSLLGPIGIGVASMASVMINQAGYQRARAALRKTYKYEIAAQLDKSPEKIKDKDIELVAKGDKELGIPANKTLAEELSHLKTRRNLGMLISTVSILGTLAIILSIPGVAAGGGLSGLTGAAGFAAKAFVGIAVHTLLEKPLNWAGKKIFGMDDITTHERIIDLNKEHKSGKVIGREQVLSVFVDANKGLDTFVKNEYGKSYDKLSVQEKTGVAEALEQHIPLTEITENLNSGRVRISELAFSVEGNTSGVKPNSVPSTLNIVGKTRVALRKFNSNLHKSSNSQDLQSESSLLPQPIETPVAAPVVPKRVVVEYDNPTPSRSFVEREAERRIATSRVLQ
ncbi:MAG: hypothetical protein ABL857_02300 [Rickettsiales bacterium]